MIHTFDTNFVGNFLPELLYLEISIAHLHTHYKLRKKDFKKSKTLNIFIAAQN